MKEYDIIVIGSGCGMLMVEEALAHGLDVALVDKGPLGGTCLNLGCIPSKTLIVPADRITEIQEGKKLGIEAEIKNIDFGSIMERLRRDRRETQSHIREGNSHTENLDFYEGVGHFVEDYTLEINGERIKGDKILIASGSRPSVPPIKGLDEIDYWTSETVLEISERPDSLIIIGGGYIGVEYAHFFAAMGTKVTVIEMADRLVLGEEPEISDLLMRKLSERMDVYTDTLVEEVRGNAESGGITAAAKDKNTGETKEIAAQRVMVATGRSSNADLLKVENTGVETDKRGFVKVNEHLETSKANIFAVGDANGKYMFTHMANREALVAVENILHKGKVKMNYSATPHAIFSHPQIASVGLTERQARRNGNILVGRAKYSDTAYGQALMEEDGFAKAIVDKGSGKILGFHIIGPYATMVIQEVTNAMTSGGGIHEINRGIHIHPTLPELIQVTLSGLVEP